MTGARLPPWIGYPQRSCGRHQPGQNRCWCFDCGTHCSRYAPCPGCIIPMLEQRIRLLEWAIVNLPGGDKALRELRDDAARPGHDEVDLDLDDPRPEAEPPAATERSLRRTRTCPSSGGNGSAG